MPPDALWTESAVGQGLLDDEGRFVTLNPALEMLLGASSRVAAGESLTRYFPDMTGFERLFSDHARVELTTRLVPGPGEEKKAWLSLRREETGGYFLEALDVGETIRVEREAAVTEASAAARDLLRNLAHEIKNPLGGIRGAAQLLEGALTNDDDRECAAIIREEADRLQALVDRFLAPYRRPNEKGPCNVSALLEHVSAPDVTGDKGRLTQVFLNIARNAAEAMGNDPAGRLTLRTRIVRDEFVRNRRVRKALAVFIEDTGPGIPETLRERLFYPLVTGRPEGSGLGLSIADAFVREAGGAIDVESEPGHTVFRVLLPL